MKKEKVKIRLRSYNDINGNTTKIANSMHEYITDAYEFSVYFYLCRKYNYENGCTTVTINEIAKDCHMGRRKAIYCIKSLCEKEFIMKNIRIKNGAFEPNSYNIRYLEIEELEKIDEKNKFIKDNLPNEYYIEIDIDAKEEKPGN